LILMTDSPPQKHGCVHNAKLKQKIGLPNTNSGQKHSFLEMAVSRLHLH